MPQLVLVFGDRVLLDVGLEALAELLHVGETGLAHAADGGEAAGEADLRLFSFELFGGLRGEGGEDGRDGGGKVEALAVGAETECLDFTDAGKALVEEILFQGQSNTPREKTIIIGSLRSLSIIIPAYNEERRLPGTLELVQRYLSTRDFEFVEVLVVDDGSRDGTAEIVKLAAAADGRVKLVSNPGNRGKGYAVRHGMREARGEWVLFTDADLSAPIEEFAKLEAAVERDGAEGAIGSRALDRKLVGKHQSAFRELSGRIFNLVMRMVTGLPYKDTQCGFKLFRRDLTELVSARQQSDGFGFDVEILYIAKKHGRRVVEVPVRWFNVEGTKVSLLNGVSAFADPLRVRWNDVKGLYR